MSNNDPYDLAGQTPQAKAKAEQERLAALQEEDLKWLMADKRGRRFFHKLLAVTGVNRNPYTGNAETYFRCGEMNVGQRYLGEVMRHCPERYVEMLKEQK